MTMDTRKMLIADASPAFCAALSELLGGVYDLRVCSDGIRAMTLLDTFQPDILVTDLVLPGVDGLTVLRKAAALSSPPSTLVLSRYYSAYIESVVGELGVDYVMLKPCDMRALVERIQDLSRRDSEVAAEPCMHVGAGNFLIMLGISAVRKGYTYLERIIDLYKKDPTRSLTKDLYPQVGKENRAEAPAVERAIRGVIHSAWERRDESLWRCYFPAGRDGSVARPTNGTFIATVAEILSRQERQRA